MKLAEEGVDIGDLLRFGEQEIWCKEVKETEGQAPGFRL